MFQRWKQTLHPSLENNRIIMEAFIETDPERTLDEFKSEINRKHNPIQSEFKKIHDRSLYERLETKIKPKVWVIKIKFYWESSWPCSH